MGFVHPGPSKFNSTFFDRELELRRDVDRLEQELEQLRGERERERLMRLATAGIPILLHELPKPLANIAVALETDLLRTLESTRIDLDLDDCKLLLAEVTARRGINLVWQIDAMPPLPFDTQVLRSLLCNLVTNALEACVDQDCIEVCAALEDGVFTLQVLDTGTGMPPETLAHCTEPFFSTKPGGFGIGLALCRELVQAADGWFDITSRRGSGTSVQICLPVRKSFKSARPE